MNPQPSTPPSHSTAFPTSSILSYKLRPRQSSRLLFDDCMGVEIGNRLACPFMPILPDVPSLPHDDELSIPSAPFAIRPRTLSVDEVSELGLSFSSPSCRNDGDTDNTTAFMAVDRSMLEGSAFFTPKPVHRVLSESPPLRRVISPMGFDPAFSSPEAVLFLPECW